MSKDLASSFTMKLGFVKKRVKAWEFNTFGSVKTKDLLAVIGTLEVKEELRPLSDR